MPLALEAGDLADTHQGGRQFRSKDDLDWKNMEAWVRGQKSRSLLRAISKIGSLRIRPFVSFGDTPMESQIVALEREVGRNFPARPSNRPDATPEQRSEAE